MWGGTEYLAALIGHCYITAKVILKEEYQYILTLSNHLI